MITNNCGNLSNSGVHPPDQPPKTFSLTTPCYSSLLRPFFLFALHPSLLFSYRHWLNQSTFLAVDPLYDFLRTASSYIVLATAIFSLISVCPNHRSTLSTIVHLSASSLRTTLSKLWIQYSIQLLMANKSLRLSIYTTLILVLSVLSIPYITVSFTCIRKRHKQVFMPLHIQIVNLCHSKTI